MTSKPWDQYQGDQDRKILEKDLFALRMGFGSKPAIIVVDVQNFMVGVEDEGDQGPSSAGRLAHDAVARIAPDGRDMGVYARKRDLLSSPRWCLAGEVGSDMVDALVPTDNDIEFVKKKPSGFHGTPLLGYLIDQQIDTVVVVGGSTSSCVRATVFDAAAYNYRVIIPQQGVFDRFPITDAMSLFDMDWQFAEVVDVLEVRNYFDGLSISESRHCLF